MMVHGNPTDQGYHEHCDKCYDVQCCAPVNVSVSCRVTKCPKNCGATFHMCKKEEHRLLCSNETVPCLNVEYGCPLTMLRHLLAKHLEVCPASVVCCSQEWNRWPVPESDVTFYRNVSKDLDSSDELSLDVGLALRDQALLFRSIKMKCVFPEMVEDEPILQRAANAVQSLMEEVVSPPVCSEVKKTTQGTEMSRQGRCALAEGGDLPCAQNHNNGKDTLRKEEEKLSRTVKNLIQEGTGEGTGEQVSLGWERQNVSLSRGEETTVTVGGTNGATGFAPWQDGVLERLGREANIAEYNMYLVHNGAMLINFGQLAACTPREKDFVYGNLEPIEVKTVRSFNVPKSYRAKRSHLKDPSNKAKTAHQSVDTSGLSSSDQELPESEEVSSTLLCSLEKELKGHLISESTSTDALYVDVGTQTYNFPSAPFRADASLADVIADRPLGLYVGVQTESVTRRHNKASSAFSYMCGRFFRRDEYPSHFRNVHCDIQASVDGWFQQRCPLAYLGCSFAQTRFCPEGQRATVKYCRRVGTLAVRPHLTSSLQAAVENSSPTGSVDVLSRLPLEILRQVAAHLDSFSLSQLSQVSHLMRGVCSTLLQDRGMVFLEWKKKTYSHGGSSWKCRNKVWRFSSLFSPVERWSFGDAPPMSEHLKGCSFYQRGEARGGPVALPCLAEVRDKHGGK